MCERSWTWSVESSREPVTDLDDCHEEHNEWYKLDDDDNGDDEHNDDGGGEEYEYDDEHIDKEGNDDDDDEHDSKDLFIPYEWHL